MSMNLEKVESSAISYYSNTSATQRILLGGDIETHSGPRSATNSGWTPTNDKQNSKNTTTPVCQKTVRMNSKRMICTNRILLTHLHRTNTKSLTISDSKNAKEWICFPWLQLSYRFTKWEINTNVKSDANYTDEHLKKLDELKKRIKYLSPKYAINVIYIRRVS